jgi:amino acid adenylation domain-containing protein/non-ribosomal peptide synthase protein (TIGR01720 family)
MTDKRVSVDLAAQQSYWMNALSGELPESTIFPDYVRPADTTGKYKHHELAFPTHLADRIKKLGNNSELSIHLLLVSATAILLQRYTGSEQVIIGSSVYKPESDQNSRYALVPLRLIVKRDSSFKDFLIEVVRKTALEAYSNQECTFEGILDLLKIKPQKGRFPLVDILVSDEKSCDSSRIMDFENDITISAASNEAGLSGSIRYSATLFKQETIDRFAAHFLNILESVLYNVNIRISEIRLLTEADEHQLLVGFNQTARDYARNESFIELFRAKVKTAGDQVAVVCVDEALTYSQLNAAANKLAHKLSSCGVGAESIVGLLSRRSPDLLAAILGVLKAGSAYLPLDPLYPASRTNLILGRSRCSVVLVSAELEDKLRQDLSDAPLQEAPQIFVIEQILESEGRLEDLPYENIANSLAYLIYTSGSTGMPKGVMIEHEGMLNHLRAKIEELELTREDSVAQTASQCFDISVWQFLAALLVGARVTIIEDQAIRDPRELLDLVTTRFVTIIEMVPTLLQTILDGITSSERPSPDLHPLRWLIATGEELKPDLCSRWIELYPQIQLLNAYGPTECSDDVTHSRLKQIPSPRGERVPIGRPIVNTSIYILDESLSLVPLGVPGELYVGGAGVGRGYLEQPEMTAECFLCDPLSPKGGSRLYKTGDVARFTPDGSIVFIGRKDHQVKIRGYRIETGEIETLLRGCPGVKEAVVVARDKASSEKQLVAYIVASGNVKRSLADVRDFLRERIAEYMIPSDLIFLDSIPLTPNGKLDRKALPAPEMASREQSDDFAPPRTHREKLLAGIWAEVLGARRVGIRDNFFELGGDSILSIHIVAKAHQQGLKLTPKQLFEHPTLAGLASVAGETSNAQRDQSPLDGAVPLTPIQHWFFSWNIASPNHFNQAILLEFVSRPQPARLEQAIQGVMRHHDALRLRFQKRDNAWHQFHADLPAADVLEQVDISSLPQADRGRAVVELTARVQMSLSLTDGPLLRFVLIDPGPEQRSRLLIVIHHLLIDIFSWRVLLEDLDRACQQLLNDQAIALPFKTTSFKAWAEHLVDYARSEALIAQKPLWLGQACGNAPKLFWDSTRDANGPLVKKALTERLNVEETNKIIIKLPQATRTQVVDVLLTGLILALARCTGKRSVLVDLETHGREEIYQEVNLSRTVGWFASIFPALLEVNDPDDAEAALRSTHERMRRIQMSGIGYGVFKFLSRDRQIIEQFDDLAGAEICFNYLGHTDLAQSGTRQFQIVPDSFELSTDSKTIPPYPLSITCFVADSCLHSRWHYIQSVQSEFSIESLAKEYVDVLRTLMDRIAAEPCAKYASSDFPGAKINEQELNTFISEISQTGDV